MAPSRSSLSLGTTTITLQVVGVVALLHLLTTHPAPSSLTPPHPPSLVLSSSSLPDILWRDILMAKNKVRIVAKCIGDVAGKDWEWTWLCCFSGNGGRGIKIRVRSMGKGRGFSLCFSTAVVVAGNIFSYTLNTLISIIILIITLMHHSSGVQPALSLTTPSRINLINHTTAHSPTHTLTSI